MHINIHLPRSMSAHSGLRVMGRVLADRGLFFGILVGLTWLALLVVASPYLWW